MAKIVATTYSDALFDLALESDTLELCAEEVQFIKEAFIENEDLVKLLNHPKIAREEKINVIKNIFSDRVSSDITSFLIIIVEKGRTIELLSIFDEFLAKYKEFKKIGVVHVTTAIDLTDEQKAKVEKKLLATTDYVKLEMNYNIEKSLIAGMVIRIGDRVVDNSIKTKLSHMSQELLKLQLV